MGQLANVSAANAATTPVTFWFKPLGPDAQGWQHFEQYTPTPANAAAAIRFAIRIKRAAPTGGDRSKQLVGKTRIEGRMWTPVMETVASNDAGITPPPTVAYQLYQETTFLIPERSTEQERNDHFTIGRGLLANGILKDVIVKLEPLF